MVRAAGEVRAVVDPDRVSAVVRPLRERRTVRANASRPFENQPMSSQDTTDGRRRDPHRMRVAAAVRELAMRAIDIAPLLEQLEDRGHLLGSQTVQRGARLAVIQAARITPAAPPPRPPLVQLEVRQARRCSHSPSTARSIRSSSSCLVAASTRRGTRPLSPSALFPPRAST